jgi:hypothetical protein
MSMLISKTPILGASGAGHHAGSAPDPGSAAGTTRYLREDATWHTAVSSVAISMPAEFSVSGSPITTSGTLSISKANQSANQVYAGPASGAAAAPSFRALAGADLGMADGQVLWSSNGTLVGIPPDLLFGGRLTLTSNTPVPTTDVTLATTIYYAPYLHDRVSLFDGTRWKTNSTGGQLSVSVGTLANATNYDVFLWNNNGTLTLTIGPAWTAGGGSDLVRGTGAGSTAISQQNGVWVNQNAISGGPAALQGIYLGTFRTTSTTTTADSGGSGATAGTRFLWNAYQRVPRSLWANPGYLNNNASTSYTTTSTTFSEANGGTGSKSQFVLGLHGEAISYTATFNLSNNTALSVSLGGVGQDSAVNAAVNAYVNVPNANSSNTASVGNTYIPGPGYHYLDLLIAAGSGSTAIFFADVGRNGSSSDVPATYLSGTLMA